MKKLKPIRLLAATLTACALMSSTAALPLAVGAGGTDGSAVEVTAPQAQTTHLENIVITTFWPPNPTRMNLEEQVRLMAEAGITEIFGAGNGCDTPEIQAQLLAEAAKHGMTMIVSDGGFGTPEEVAATVAKYADNPLVTGFHLEDEPPNANVHINTYKTIRETAPHLDGHINFIHMTATGGEDGYRRRMGDWLSLTNAVSDTPTWLMYDYYPFLYDEAPFDYSLYLHQLNLVRQIGLQNGCPTGYYLQSAYDPDYPFNPANMRTPNAAENRYEVYSALAHGFKKLSYFTWVTGIVSLSGVVSECYDYIAQVNHEVLALGPTLAKCDAIDVYMTRNQYEHTELLPEDYILRVAEGQNADMILSRLVHQETGRNYIMLVNNDMTAEQSLTFTVDEDITGLEVVSKTDGTLSPYEGEDGRYTVTLAAGDGILLALPEDYVCPVDIRRANDPLTGVNLAPTAKLTASSSLGEDGWFLYNMFDGINKPAWQKNDAKGWCSHNDSNPVLTFDFGEPIALDTVTLYPSGASHNRKFGVHMPVDFTVSVSSDGDNWTVAATVTDYENSGSTSGDPLEVALEGAVGRYLRIHVTKANLDENGQALTQIGEIEILGTPAADRSGLGDLVKNYVRFGGDTSDGLYLAAASAAKDAASRQGYVDYLVQQLSPVVDQLEANYVEPPETQDTETATPDTEAATKAEDTTAEATEPEATEAVTHTNHTDTPDSEGCGSTLGLGAAALLTVAAAAVALKRKN